MFRQLRNDSYVLLTERYIYIYSCYVLRNFTEIGQKSWKETETIPFLLSSFLRKWIPNILPGCTYSTSRISLTVLVSPFS